MWLKLRHTLSKGWGMADGVCLSAGMGGSPQTGAFEAWLKIMPKIRHHLCISIPVWKPAAGLKGSNVQVNMRYYSNTFKWFAAIAISLLVIAASSFMVGAKSVTQALGVENPSVGIGLNGIADWSTQMPFIDIMKTARPWVGHLPGQWGGMDSGALEAGGFLDQYGWPKSIPPDVTGLETLFMTDQPQGFLSLSGRYRVRYKGAGKIKLTGRAKKIRYGQGEIWFSYAPGDGPVGIYISKTDPNQSGDYIRDISVVPQDLIPHFEVGAKFNPDWLARVQDFRMVRFMDWMFTNGSDVRNWADRPRPQDYTYIRRGVPVEILVDLANTIAADPWFNMPHMADDEYFRNFAQYVRLHLSSKLRAHVEYSNELWNFIFPQALWAQAQAEARWGDAAGGDGWMQYSGLRAAQMAAIWANVFGLEAEARLVTVIATHSGWPGLEQTLLLAPLWMAEENGPKRPPVAYFDAYAITGYFGYELGTDERAPQVLDWISESLAQAEKLANDFGLTGLDKDRFIDRHGFDQANMVVAADLRDGSLSELIDVIFPYQSTVAKQYGLDLVMYEGGTHVAGSGVWVENEDLTAFFTQFNYSAEMGDLYDVLLAEWRQAGGTVFNAFVDVSLPSKWGSWGALRYLDDNNPRFDSITKFNRNTPGWWETRHPNSFTHGRTVFGTLQDDILSGTPKVDILLGLAGADVLVAAGDGDRLHGGDGLDTAVLPGVLGSYTFQAFKDLTLALGPDGRTWLYSIENIRFSGQSGPDIAVMDLR